MAKMNTTKPTTKSSVTEKEVVYNTTKMQSPDLSEILRRLDVVEKENAELKAKSENPIKNAKDRYEWPRHYSYKMWAWVPVCSYVSKRKDASKDLLYKDYKGNYISNHILELTMADGKKLEVEVNEFNWAFTRSPKMPCEVKSDWMNVTWYVFNDDKLGTFTVMPNMIN